MNQMKQSVVSSMSRCFAVLKSSALGCCSASSYFNLRIDLFDWMLQKFMRAGFSFNFALKSIVKAIVIAVTGWTFFAEHSLRHPRNYC